MNNVFDFKTPMKVIGKALGLRPGNDVEIQRDRLDAHRVPVPCHVKESSAPDVNQLLRNQVCSNARASEEREKG